MKKRIIYAIISLILIMLIGAGAYYYNRQITDLNSQIKSSQEKIKTLEDEKADLVSWKEYSNPTYNFAMKYPPNWTFIEENGKDNKIVSFYEKSTEPTSFHLVNRAKAANQSLVATVYIDTKISESNTEKSIKVNDKYIVVKMEKASSVSASVRASLKQVAPIVVKAPDPDPVPTPAPKSSSGSSKSSSSVTPATSSGTYKNTKYGYTVKVPSGFRAIVGSADGAASAGSESQNIAISNGVLDVDINAGVASPDAEILGVPVGLWLTQLAHTCEMAYNTNADHPTYNTQYVKFEYFKKSFTTGQFAGYVCGVNDNQVESETNGKYVATYRMQTKHNSSYFEILYMFRVPQSEKDSASLQDAISQAESIISTIEFTQ